MTRPATTNSARDLSALMHKLRKHTKAVVQENVIAKQTVSKLRRKNAKLKARMEQLQQQNVISDGDARAQASLCRNCKEVVYPGSSCISHPGKFYDIEGNEHRELDSDSET